MEVLQRVDDRLNRDFCQLEGYYYRGWVITIGELSCSRIGLLSPSRTLFDDQPIDSQGRRRWASYLAQSLGNVTSVLPIVTSTAQKVQLSWCADQ